MTWFKPAAGLIFLVFILSILFSLFSSYQENAKLEEKEKQQQASNAANRAGYNNCIEAVKTNMSIRKMQVAGYMEKIKNNGELTKEINDCVLRLDNLLTPPPDSLADYLSRHNKMIYDRCESDIIKNYTFSQELEEEEKEMKLACESRFGN